jgi:hypothetical protein
MFNWLLNLRPDRRAGLQSNEEVIVPGAQTERRDDAGPVRSLLGGQASPAAHFTLIHQTDP